MLYLNQEKAAIKIRTWNNTVHNPCYQVSPWLTWWDYLHPSTEDFHANLGVPIPLDCAKPAPEERVFIKNGFDGFHRTNLHDYLRTQKVDTLVVMGLITRACVLNTIMSAFNYGWAVGFLLNFKLFVFQTLHFYRYRILVVRDACGDREIKVIKLIWLTLYKIFWCLKHQV